MIKDACSHPLVHGATLGVLFFKDNADIHLCFRFSVFHLSACFRRWICEEMQRKPAKRKQDMTDMLTDGRG